MKQAFLILITALTLACPALAGSLDSAGLEKIRAALAGRKPDAEALGKLVDEAKAVNAAGASLREILALLEAAPAKADASELLKTLVEMKELLDEGLLDREARKVALKGLELRLKSPSNAKGGKPLNASEALRLKREESLKDRDQARREEIRDRVGRNGQDGDLAKPTPSQH